MSARPVRNLRGVFFCGGFPCAGRWRRRAHARGGALTDAQGRGGAASRGGGAGGGAGSRSPTGGAALNLASTSVADPEGLFTFNADAEVATYEMPHVRPPALAKRAKSPRRAPMAAEKAGGAGAPAAGGGIIAAAIERLDKKAEEGSGGLNIVRLALLSPESAAKEAAGGGGGDGAAADAAGETAGSRKSAATAAGGGDAALEALAVATMLRTGEDAIAFFARYGDSCPVKFVHLARAPEGKRFRPYDLVVVPESETGSEYFTMSGKGVVHIQPDAPSVFIALAEWMRQSAMFNVLSSKHYFKHYLVGKALHRWRANVRFNRFAQKRSAIGHRLFAAMSAFCGPINDVHGVLFEMLKVPLIEAASKKTYELVDFDAAQATCRSAATTALDVLQKKILHVVERVVVDITGRARVDEDEDAKADAHKSSKTQSMLAAKQELARKARALKQARTEESLLGHFIRYVDYMCVEALVELAISAHERFLGELVSPAQKRKVGLFETSVKFNARGTAFEPTCEEYLVMIRHVSELTISVVQHVERVLYHRSLKTYTHGLYTDPPLTDALIRDSPTFVRARACIEGKFDDDFAEAVEYAKGFKDVRPIFDSMQAQDAEIEKLKSGNWSVSAIKGDMARINGWEKELERMHAQHMREGGGILHVESRKLKLLLTPVTTNALTRIKAMLREVARERCGEVLREYTERGRILEGRPKSLPTFAAYVEKIKELKSEEKQFGKQTSVVEEMYRLLTTCGVRTTSEEQVQVDEMRSAQTRYQEESVKSEDFVGEKMKEMTVVLENSISKLNDEIVTLRGTVETGMYVDASAEPATVLQCLSAVGTTLASQEERAAMYNKWQALFNTQVFEFKAVRAFQDVFKLRQGLWASLHKFKTLHHTWMHSPLVRVDVEELNRSVQVLLKTAFVADKKLNDEVSARFKNEVQDFKRAVPVIMDLGNPNMRDRHWEKLYTGLGQAWIPGNDTFTIEELAAYGVFDRVDLVADLSGTASGEAQLEESLRKIKNVWATTEFVCKNYREQRKVFILSGLDEVFVALEDNQVTLQTMMGSRYIEGVRSEVEEWDRKLSILSDTLDEWVTVQKNWMYLETIFTAEDIQKQLPAEATKFMKVDKTWKSVMVKTQAAPLVINAVADGPALKNSLVVCNTLLEEIQKSLEDYLETKRSGFPRFYFLSNDELLQILSQTRDPTAVQPHLRKCFDSIARVDFAAREANEITAMISAEGEKVKFSSPVKATGNVENWLTDVEGMMCTTLYDKSKASLKDYPPHETATKRAGWFFKYPAQVILVVDQIVWTGNCRAAIDAASKGKTTALKDFLAFSLEQINDMVTLVRGELSKLDRTLLGALVVIDVHARDTIMTMVRKGVKTLDDFEWTRQLRYTWEDDVDDVVCRQTNTYFRYCYEYLGNGPRLVITPLTDKCYMTLTGALHLKFGGAPAGPAGTGKTETVKDLSKALAVQCVVFNCSDGLDYKMMGRFFSGLAQSGAWSCFDEFNRIDIEVLSVIAQQILCIQQGLMVNAKEIEFEGRVIPLSPQFGVFITMNPGYAGRTELPDNLKALFRPVAMMVPDYRLIAEIILFSQGFQEALPLSNKMVQLYKLASEQLSKQDHYDFGMRAVKSVLVAAGQLKRKEPDVDENILLIRAMRDSNVPKFLSHDLPLFSGIVQDLFPGVNVPFVDYGKLQMAIENQLEKRGLQRVDTLITKIIQVHETQLVRHGMMIVGEAGSAKSTNSGVLAAALNQLKDDGVVDKDGFFQHTHLYTLNPKSITMGELYGEFDAITAEWTDGLVAALFRNAVADQTPDRKWMYFDGPVDALWIESMNTVLDDSKMLCLVNGERIKMPEQVHMMFEVMDLAVASPATVSRCGMVFMEQVHIGLAPVVKTWSQGEIRFLLPEMIGHIMELINEHLEPTFAFLREHCRQVIPAKELNIVQSFLFLLTSLLTPERGVRGRGWNYRKEREAAERAAETEKLQKEKSKHKAEGGEAAAGAAPAAAAEPGAAGGEPAVVDEAAAAAAAAAAEAKAKADAAAAAAAVEAEALAADADADVELQLQLQGLGRKGGEGPLDSVSLRKIVDITYVFCYVWSFGANVHDDSREKFNTFAMGTLAALIPEDVQGGNLYEYYVDADTHKMQRWATLMKNFVYNPELPYFNILVPTIDTTRYSWLSRLMLENGRNVLVSGETGVGKSVVLADTINDMSSGDDARFVSCAVNFSAQTTSANLQEVFESKLDKKRKNLLGPPAGKRMIMFVDDLNMPALEQYGAQPPIELLRQVIDQGGFYDREKLFFKNVASCVYAGACAPPGGGRNEVSPRLLRHYHMIWVTSLAGSSMARIFTSILGGYLAVEAPAVLDLATPIVNATVAMYQLVEKELLPTPAKSHYTFNLRDLSKVFQGVLMCRSKALGDKPSVVKVWLHEVARTFRDRLVSDEDREWFNVMCKNQLKEHLSLEWDLSEFADVLVGDYTTRDDRQYRIVAHPEKLEELFNGFLEEYNLSFPSQMHLVFFKDAIAHVSRICRVLRQPRGNALLVGVGGSGRQSLTRLAAFVSEYTLSSIEITRIYGMDQWHDDIKKMIMMAGIENKNVVFLLTDSQIAQEAFLEDVNNILNSGDVPNLYAPDELERIVGGCRAAVKAAGKVDARDVILQHYVQTVRERLHVVLCFSPVGSSFRNRCRMFPSLVNCCTVDWFSAWPPDALYSVAESFLSRAGPELGIQDIVDPLCNMCVSMHRSVKEYSERFLAEHRRHVYTTPTSYLELIRLYTGMLGEQRDVVTRKVRRYEGGLQKLVDTNQMVFDMEAKLKDLQPTLKKAASDTAELLVRLSEDQKVADEAAVVAAKDEADCAVVARRVAIMKDECQADLDEALPAYFAALKALDSLDKKQIGEVKGFPKPPRMVGVVLEAVCTLLGKPTTWEEAKKVMSDARFMNVLKEYDKDNIKPAIIKKLKVYIDDPEFSPEKIKSVSLAATSLCMWAHAMYKYDQVAKTIAPKRAKLAEAEAELAASQAVLAEKQSRLKGIMDRIAELKASYDSSLAKRDQLEQQMAKTKLRLDRAHKLTDGLGDEAARWGSAARQLNEDLANLVGNIVLAAGFVAYVGPFNAEYRTGIARLWAKQCKEFKIPVDQSFDLVRILADPVQVREWNILGLPADDFSTENGMFATLGRRWPLMIDPQGQANRWVKNMYKEGLQVIKLTQSDFLRTLENAIRFGQAVLLENVEEELDPALEPVLLKQTFKKGGQVLLHLGDSDVPYSDNFELFITTKLANPHYMPEVCIKVTVINFTVTSRGLEDQLLVDVVRFERPDLERKKDELIVTIAADKKELKAIEDKILKMLAEASGDILEDEMLINSLAASKTTSQTISSRMKEAEKTTEEINTARNQYRPVATRGSVLYFVIADLAMVDNMYQYSLPAFSRLYNMRIERSAKAEDIAERVRILEADLTESFYVNVCRGLFEIHKLLYSFLIGIGIMRRAGKITDAEWKAFLIGTAVKDNTEKPPAGCEWMLPKTWNALVGLSRVAGFTALDAAVRTTPEEWRRFAQSETVQTDTVPGGWHDRLSIFQRALLVRTLREERTVRAVRTFVVACLGKKFAEAPQLDLEASFADSTSQTPLIFVLSPGAAPIDYLMQLARAKGKAGPGLRLISLGQGQGPIAERMMQAARKSGDWVVLQNCHLAASWLPKLEAIVEANAGGTDEHPEYRLWLTSMPSDRFPVPMLQVGIKMTQEPPRGLKSNMMRTFLDLADKDYEGCSKPRPFKKLLFGLAFYHALILERRKFGAIGWNIPYEWMNSDLKTGIMQLKMYLEEQPKVPFETLNAVVGDITYGGRATDAWDKRTNLCVLLKYFCPEVLDDGYRFSESGKYFAPPEGELKDVRAYVAELPLDDAPETFGLHANASITLQAKETFDLMTTVVSIQPRSGGGEGEKSPDEIVGEIADDIERRLPREFSKKSAHASTFATIADGSVSSLGVFCEQEMVRFNKLISVVSKSLSMLKRAIKGLVVMSSQLETMHQSFLFQRVPPDWEAAAYPSLKPLASWVEDLFARLTFLDNWLRRGPPAAFWLSGFFFPQGFMTGALQTHSRKTRVAIDTLAFRTTVMDVTEHEVRAPPENGVYIYGLFFEGARWDRKRKLLEEMEPSVLYDYMPCIWLDPVLAEKVNTANTYECPVYKTSKRAGTLSTTGHSTNFIVTLYIATDKPEAHWVRRGVALLSQLDT